MSVRRPSAYEVYARVSGGAFVTGSPGLLRPLVPEGEGGPVFLDQSRHHRLAAVVEPLERTGRVTRQGVGREQRQAHGVVHVADHGARQHVGVDLAPGHRFARRGAGESAGVGAGVGELQEVVVAPLVDAEHFLDLRLGLEQEVLGTAAASDQGAALATTPLGLEHDRRGLIDVRAHVEAELAAG